MIREQALEIANKAAAIAGGKEWINLDQRANADGQADRLFTHALDYKYGPDVLYAQQREWLGLPKLPFEAQGETGVAFTTFHAVANALSPLIDKDWADPAPAPQQSNRVQGFDKGFGDDDRGNRAQRVGDERVSDGEQGDTHTLARKTSDDNRKGRSEAQKKTTRTRSATRPARSVKPAKSRAAPRSAARPARSKSKARKR